MYKNQGKLSAKKDSKITSPKPPASKQHNFSSHSKETRNARSATGESRSSLTGQLKPMKLNQNSTNTDFINNAIFEYLQKNQMFKTLDQFQAELNRGVSLSKDIDQNLQTHLIDAFDKGNREAFFIKWDKFIIPKFKGKESIHEKLEFYLRLYFVAFSIHPINPKPGNTVNKEELLNFKLYLDTKGSDFAQTTEFIQYYAFPYVPNPKEHQSFKHIFTREWVKELRVKLQNFLSGPVTNEESPILYQMYKAYASESPQNSKTQSPAHGKDKHDVEDYAKVIAQLEASNQDLMNILQDCYDKYGHLTKEYQILQKNEEMARNHLFESQTKWMTFLKEIIVVANDLVGVIENQQQGVLITDKLFDALKQRVQNYENFLNSNLDDFFSQSQDISTFDKISTSQDVGTPDHSSIMHANYRAINRVEERPPPQIQPQQQKENQSYVALNFQKIKSQLVSSSTNEPMQCSLLQALRWRITRTRGASLRREVIIGYSKHDILDIRRDFPCVVESIFKQKGQKVGEYGARFINSLTSDYYGRTYLLESDKLVLLLIEIFTTEKGDTVVRRNCLGALQKLSLRKKPQFIMIEKDIIKWILNTLKYEKEELGEYFYEYATALLMNLSLRAAGKKKCEESEVEILEILGDLLEHENMQVRSFVNGTLYSLLSNHAFREQAHAMGMSEMLTFLMENADERYKKQIHYIFQRLNSEKVEEEEESHSDTNDEDNDYDDMEDEDEIGEDDEMEENLEDPNVLVGEELLRKYFSLSGPEALRQNSMINEAMEESRSFIRESTLRQTTSDIGTPLNRPTTPGMLNKIIQQQTGMGGFVAEEEEFKSKPKIPRTPYQDEHHIKHSGGQLEKEHNVVNEQDYFSLANNRGNDNRQSFNDLKINVHPAKNDDHQTNHINKQHEDHDKTGNESEFLKAFESKPRILRTPPQEKMNKKGNFMNS